jgi:ankyrin repeat protein
MKKIISLSILSVIWASLAFSEPLNIVSFDNKSGEFALVKLMGPSATTIEVPRGETGKVNAAAGDYYLLIRFGEVPESYRYARGDDFKVTETASQYSITTITLFPVVNGNYDTHPISRKLFDQAVAGKTDNIGTPASAVPPSVPPAKNLPQRHANSNSVKSLIYACDEGNSTKVKDLLAQGVDPNGTDEDGATPLMFAVRKGNASIARRLIERGASVVAHQKDGFTPLIIASMFNQLDLITVLTSAGARVDAGSDNGFTALHYASQGGNVQIVSALLASGATVDLKNSEGATPLHLAAQNGYVDITIQLLKAHANLNAVSLNGVTPLISAAFKGHTAVVKILSANGADVNARDKSGRTAADWARQRRFGTIVEIIEGRVSLGATP